MSEIGSIEQRLFLSPPHPCQMHDPALQDPDSSIAFGELIHRTYESAYDPSVISGYFRRKYHFIPGQSICIVGGAYSFSPVGTTCLLRIRDVDAAIFTHTMTADLGIWGYSTEQDELGLRPWRRVIAPRVSERVLLSTEVTLRTADLPRRQSRVGFNYRKHEAEE